MEEEVEAEESVGMILRDNELLGEGTLEKISRNKIDIIPEVDEETGRESLRSVSIPKEDLLESMVPEQDLPQVLLPQNAPLAEGLHLLHPVPVDANDVVDRNIFGSLESGPHGFVSIHDESNGVDIVELHAQEDSIQKTNNSQQFNELLKMSRVRMEESVPVNKLPTELKISESGEKSGSVVIEPIPIRENSKVVEEGAFFGVGEPLWADIEESKSRKMSGNDTRSFDDDSNLLSSAYGLKKRADELFHQGQYKGAVEAYSQALRMMATKAAQDKSSAEGVLVNKIHANISSCKMREKKWEEAIFHSNLVIEADPSFVKAYFRVAQSLRALGREVEASKVLRDGLPAIKASKNDTLQRDYLFLYSQLAKHHTEPANPVPFPRKANPNPKPAQQVQQEILKEDKDSGNSDQIESVPPKSNVGAMASCVLAGVIAGGVFLAAKRSKAAALSFGATAVGTFAAQNNASIAVKGLAVLSVAAFNFLLWKKFEG
jgi:tetratricopeptide (TPR) repeat protein